MSGHSKWSTIKRQKGAADLKRGQAFTKLSNAITLAVRQGGGIGDPDSNFKLRLAIEAARSANMPKDNIERAIDRAAGKQADAVEEVTYEGFGPGGFSVIVEAITDNKQRTTPLVKTAFDKNGGSMGTPGAVSYQFEQKGSIIVKAGSRNPDELFLIAADCGADDIEEAGDEIIVYTQPEALAKVRACLLERGMEVVTAELVRKPIVISVLRDRDAATKALTFIERIEDIDDVQKVYANFDIPEEYLN
jgi:YebC/PmpR family DNA-binding regulatory protein